jgi:hypothetical protein
VAETTRAQIGSLSRRGSTWSSLSGRRRGGAGAAGSGGGDRTHGAQMGSRASSSTSWHAARAHSASLSHTGDTPPPFPFPPKSQRSGGWHAGWRDLPVGIFFPTPFTDADRRHDGRLFPGAGGATARGDPPCCLRCRPPFAVAPSWAGFFYRRLPRGIPR